jgi:tRNA-splicing ligase RtcB
LLFTHGWLRRSIPRFATLQRIRRTEDIVHLAVMPDVHLPTQVCVGTAMATRRLIYPGAVGGDIGCGMLAIALDATADLLTDPRRAGLILREIGRSVPGRRHHRPAIVPMPENCKPTDLSHGRLSAIARGDGTLQFGTLGGGNHFIELQADEDDRLWIMVHSGSRAMGQAIRHQHVARATIRSSGMAALDSATDAGEAYLNDAGWARRYADASRRAMAQRVAEVLTTHGAAASTNPI